MLEGQVFPESYGSGRTGFSLWPLPFTFELAFIGRAQWRCG
jgi:hypothetical protein